MKLTRLIIWVVLAFVAFKLYGYVKVHSSGDVIAYKSFAEALRADDRFAIKRIVIDEELAQKVLETQPQRKDLLEGNSVLFTYYVIQRQTFANDGETSFIFAEQVNRVDPPGESSFIGETAIRTSHGVELVKKDGKWRVVSFDDPAMR